MNDNFRFRLVFLVFLVPSFSSCITHKNLEYLSTEDGMVSSIPFEYVIQTVDVLSVRISSTTKSDYDFFNLEETSNPQLLSKNPYLYGYIVRSDGIMSLPMIGDIKAEGFTMSEIEKVIEQISSTYFKILLLR